MTEAAAPRLLVTGIDASGRSSVVKEVPLSSELLDADGFRHALLYSSVKPPPSRPPGRGELLELGLSPGGARWGIVEYRPNQFYPMHHTDTVDFDILLEGSLALQLDDGIHPLNVGDCVIVAGVDHAWKSGPEGCRLSVAMVATSAP